MQKWSEHCKAERVGDAETESVQLLDQNLLFFSKHRATEGKKQRQRQRDRDKNRERQSQRHTKRQTTDRQRRTDKEKRRERDRQGKGD